jgi:hypothetical protein
MHQTIFQNYEVNHNYLDDSSHDSDEQDEKDDINVIEN